MLCLYRCIYIYIGIYIYIHTYTYISQPELLAGPAIGEPPADEADAREGGETYVYMYIYIYTCIRYVCTRICMYIYITYT